jgi:hypothetical protein
VRRPGAMTSGSAWAVLPQLEVRLVDGHNLRRWTSLTATTPGRSWRRSAAPSASCPQGADDAGAARLSEPGRRCPDPRQGHLRPPGPLRGDDEGPALDARRPEAGGGVEESGRPFWKKRSARQHSPHHRYHQKAARAVLKRCRAGSDIRGRCVPAGASRSVGPRGPSAGVPGSAAGTRW